MKPTTLINVTKALLSQFVVIFTMAIAACNQPEESQYHFAIYLPADKNTKFSYLSKDNLDTLKLDSDPWISEHDLLMYDYSSHLMYLKGNKEDLFEYSDNPPNSFTASWCDRPFVVVAEGVRAYVGRFLCAIVSSPPLPVPEINDFSLYSSNVLSIEWNMLFLNEDDSRNNGLVRSALINAGLYHAGLSVELTSLDLLENDEYAKIEYTFTLTNNDGEALYIPDPALMGDDLYHYYMNGLAFYNLNTTEDHQREYVESNLGDEAWSPDWYVRVPSGESFTRTTIVDHIKRLTLPDDYLSVISYLAPPLIPENELSALDGRYWLGHVFSDVIGVFIE